MASHALTLLSDSIDAHMAIWRLRAALPECAVTIRGRDVIIAAADGGDREVEWALSRIPDVRAYLSW